MGAQNPTRCLCREDGKGRCRSSGQSLERMSLRKPQTRATPVAAAALSSPASSVAKGNPSRKAKSR